MYSLLVRGKFLCICITFKFFAGSKRDEKRTKSLGSGSSVEFGHDRISFTDMGITDWFLTWVSLIGHHLAFRLVGHYYFQALSPTPTEETADIRDRN